MLNRLLLLILLIIPCLAKADSTYLQELKAQSRQKSLSNTTTWLALLHYAPHYLGLQNKGEVDGGDFYLAKNGKTNPQSELETTLENFFRTDVAGDDHPQCRFVARYAWLKQELNFDPNKLPEQKCPRYQEWLENLKPAKATIVFPAAYLNNPSSMFGHTLLRIDPEGQSNDERLTSYGVNYGANTGESQGLLFAVKGIFGGYGGGFSIAPYYTQVLDYSEIENRDIWEYELNLTKAEVQKLVSHLWELRSVSFDYYFFDENCSYHLLSLLENARPDSKLRSKTSIAVVPVDSVRIVLQQTGMLNKAVFRASNKKILDQRFSELSTKEKLIAKDLGKHSNDGLKELDGLELAEQPEVLDAGIDLLTYRTYKQPELIEKESGYQFELFKRRSALPAPVKEILVVPPPRPDLGHDTNRFTLGLGSYDKKGFYEIAFRPAYHDLLDPDFGYTKGAQIQFGGTKFRQIEGDGLKLEKFDLLDILSFSPWDEVFHGISWRITTGSERTDFSHGERSLTYVLNTGGGIALQPAQQLMLFALVGPEFLWSEKLANAANLGIGPTLGGLFSPTDRLKLLTQVSGGEYFIGTGFSSYKVTAEVRYTIDTNLAIRASFDRSLNFGGERDFENWVSSTTISVMKYF